MFAKVGTQGVPMATPSIYLYNLLSNKKTEDFMAKIKSDLKSALQKL